LSKALRWIVADGTLPTLLGNFSIKQLPHLSWRPEFPVSPGVMRIFDTLNTQA
jgi:hypothetical protein